MGVSLFVFVCITCSAYGVLEIYFSHVANVPLSEYVNDTLAVDQNASRFINCAILCRTDCYSFAYDPGTKKCNTYLKKFISGVTTTPAIQTFVKGVPSPPQETPTVVTDLVSGAETSTVVEDPVSGSETSTVVTDPVSVSETSTVVPGSDITACSDVDPAYPSGVFTITPSPGLSYDVYCDTDTKDGPWTVMQNRQDGQVNFYRNWTEYKNGFGDLNGNFWSGLEIIHLLTRKTSVLRIELVSWSGDVAYAEYSSFSIGAESSKYRISFSGFSGNVSHDAMTFHKGYPFTTYDNDNSVIGGCAKESGGAWWYKDCYDSNLNGLYMQDTGGDPISYAEAMVWWKFYPGRTFVPMMKTRMLVKNSGV